MVKKRYLKQKLIFMKNFSNIPGTFLINENQGIGIFELFRDFLPNQVKFLSFSFLRDIFIGVKKESEWKKNPFNGEIKTLY